MTVNGPNGWEHDLIMLQADENQPGASEIENAPEPETDALANAQDAASNAASLEVDTNSAGDTSGALSQLFHFDELSALIGPSANITAIIGAVVFVVLLALIIFLMRRGRAQRMRSTDPENPEIFASTHEDGAGKAGTGKAGTGKAGEVDHAHERSDNAGRYDGDHDATQSQREPFAQQHNDPAAQKEIAESIFSHHPNDHDDPQVRPDNLINNATNTNSAKSNLVRAAFDTKFEEIRRLKAENDRAKTGGEALREGQAHYGAPYQDDKHLGLTGEREAKERESARAETQERDTAPHLPTEETLLRISDKLNALEQNNAALTDFAESLTGIFDRHLEQAFEQLEHHLALRLPDPNGLENGLVHADSQNETDDEDAYHLLSGVEDALLAQSEGIRADTRNIVDALGKRLEELSSQIDTLTKTPQHGMADTSALQQDIAALRTALSERLAPNVAAHIQLQDVLQNTLSRNSYDTDVILSEGRRADALIRFSDDVEIAIDTAFPLEALHKLHTADTKDTQTQDFAKSEFRRTALGYIVSVAEHLTRHSGTPRAAIVFLPTDAVHAEIQHRFPDIVQDAWRANVWLVGPASLATTLNVTRALKQQTPNTPLKDARDVAPVTETDDQSSTLADDIATQATETNPATKSVESTQLHQNTTNEAAKQSEPVDVQAQTTSSTESDDQFSDGHEVRSGEQSFSAPFSERPSLKADSLGPDKGDGILDADQTGEE